MPWSVTFVEAEENHSVDGTAPRVDEPLDVDRAPTDGTAHHEDARHRAGPGPKPLQSKPDPRFAPPSRDATDSRNDEAHRVGSGLERPERFPARIAAGVRRPIRPERVFRHGIAAVAALQDPERPFPWIQCSHAGASVASETLVLRKPRFSAI